MRHTDLVAHYVQRFGLTRRLAGQVIAELRKVCVQELLRTGEFTVPGISKLVLHEHAARPGRNPSTGEPITISARTVVRARILKPLKDAVR